MNFNIWHPQADSSACGVSRATGDQFEHFGPLPRPGAAEAASTAETADTPAGHPERRHVASGTADVQEQTAAAPAGRRVRPLIAAADTGEAVRLSVWPPGTIPTTAASIRGSWSQTS